MRFRISDCVKRDVGSAPRTARVRPRVGNRSAVRTLPEFQSAIRNPQLPMVIRLQNITKVYRVGAEHVHALAGVDLEVGHNEYVAVMGTSGSGKSTLMNIVGCLDRPTTGVYELDGRVTTELGAAALANVRN